uniref:Uncharacterized protein n=1 Tax=Arundo donax TaxID=35708 RepID=A0A0A9BQB1_ARUDO
MMIIPESRTPAKDGLCWFHLCRSAKEPSEKGLHSFIWKGMLKAETILFEQTSPTMMK